ncbi:MAG TPA: aminotransferase class V-fold PLP-dependent enzyme, partial [Clostridia bacterium]|nr:aminotransferase class V-fold PLP-dependent enzyme [Clostridia bacterium]
MQVYLDNAATSRQKPPEVFRALEEFFIEINCNPGRGGYGLSLEAGRRVMEGREVLAALFHVPQPNQVIFTQNVTMSLNIALKGLLGEGDHVLITGLEHNAVLRPLNALQRERGVTYTVVPTSPRGHIEPEEAEKLINPRTRMILATHASNVMGTLVPIKELGDLAGVYGLELVIDAAQTAGCLPLDFQRLNASILAFTGHIHLLGPMGIGGFCIKEDVAKRLRPFYEGGTGSVSDQEEQPGFLPDKFESGTLNTLGIVGLGAAVNYLQGIGIQNIRQREMELTARLLAGLSELPGVVLYGPRDPKRQTGTVA